MLHKDLCVDIVKVHKLVSLYVAQPKLAQLVRNIHLFRDAGTDDEDKPEVKNIGIYMPIIRSSGLTRRHQRILKSNLRRQNRQAHMALLLLQTPNLQGLLLGEMSHGQIRFLNPVFFNGSASTADSGHEHPDSCHPYLKAIITKRLKSKLAMLEMPFHGLWDTISRHQKFDLSEYTQLTHVTTCIGELMATRRKAWDAKPVYVFGVLPKTLTHLTLGGACCDLRHLLAHLVLEHTSGRLPKLRSLVVYTKYCDCAQTRRNAAYVQSLADTGVTATLRCDGPTHVRYGLRLDTLETGCRFHYINTVPRFLEM
jgi:hypothetical protein